MTRLVTSRASACNVHPLSREAEAGILAAFGGALPEEELEALFAPPEAALTPTTLLSLDDLRFSLRGMVEAAAIVHRCLMALERAKTPFLDVSDADCPDGSLAALSFALSIQEATGPAIRQKHVVRPRKAGKARNGYAVATVEPMSDAQYADAMQFASKVSVDLRGDDSFAGALNASIPADVLESMRVEFSDEDEVIDLFPEYEAFVLEDEGDELPTMSELANRIGAVRAARGTV